MKSVGAAGLALRDVSLVLCTCRRLPLFRETVLSLMRNLPEMSEVGRIVVIDDNSSLADRLRMKREFPRFDFMFKSAEDAGHARSLNMMLDCVDTPLIVYWEDDCVLETCGPWLSLAQNVLNSERSIICVSFDPSIENDARCARRRVWQPGGREIAFRTHAPEAFECYRPPHEFVYERDAWPGFSLKPNMMAVQRVREVGRFAEHDNDHMEYEFGLRCLQRGLRTAVLSGPVIRDIGAGSSAYVLNGRARSYDRVVNGSVAQLATDAATSGAATSG